MHRDLPPKRRYTTTVLQHWPEPADRSRVRVVAMGGIAAAFCAGITTASGGAGRRRDCRRDSDGARRTSLNLAYQGTCLSRIPHLAGKCRSASSGQPKSPRKLQVKGLILRAPAPKRRYVVWRTTRHFPELRVCQIVALSGVERTNGSERVAEESYSFLSSHPARCRNDLWRSAVLLSPVRANKYANICRSG